VKPISEVELWDKIMEAEGRMSPRVFRLWEAIRIVPAVQNLLSTIDTGLDTVPRLGPPVTGPYQST
jgi:hypothetical protein